MAIKKNGFQFHEIPLELWDSNDYCLACHKLPTEQTTVEFSGSWPLQMRYQEEVGGPWLTKTVIFNKFHVQYEIWVENSSSKWISFSYINGHFEATNGVHYDRGFNYDYFERPGEPLPPKPDQSYYQLLWLFNSEDYFDLSKLTLTSPDRLDAKGTYYINWQTYQFQNNGEQLIRDAIKPEFADKKDFIMQTYGLILRAFRTLGIEEWLPGDTKKSNIEIYDKNRTYPEWKPLRHSSYLYLSNLFANIYYRDYDDNYDEVVFHQTDNFNLRFTYYVK